jgi:aminoglycoside phosphotransferase (APT) family kinase protein
MGGVDLEKLIDFAALAAWMDSQGLESGPITDIAPLGGGTQNVLVRFRRGARDFVLRRGPVHLRPVSNKVIGREMQVLSALSGTLVPCPRFLAGCTDESVLGGAVFYLSEVVDGFNPTQSWPDAWGTDARREFGLSVVDGLLELGTVDHVQVGLADFGKADGFLERQVPRWHKDLQGYREIPEYPHDSLPGIDDVADWLAKRTPSLMQPGIMHGDSHLANVMCSSAGPRLAAIVDWEMSTIGDPLLDLAWLWLTWPGRGDTLDQLIGVLGAQPGLPTPGEVIDRYAAGTHRDLADFDWYRVLAAFKFAIVLEGTLARALVGNAPKDVGDQLHAHSCAALKRVEFLVK